MTIRWLVMMVMLVLGLFSGFRPWQVGCAVVLAAIVIVSVFPRSGVARFLFSRHGPSLEVASMTQRECWRSAGGFLVNALASVATIYGVTLLEPWLGRDPLDVPVLMALVFMYSLFVMMGVAGALYLVVRAPFRPETLPESSEDGIGV